MAQWVKNPTAAARVFAEAQVQSPTLCSGLKDPVLWSSCHGTEETNPTRNHEVAVRSLASLTGLRIRRWHELSCRLQTWIGSGIAVALASSCSSNSIPSLGTSICHRCSHRKKKKRLKRNEDSLRELWVNVKRTNIHIIEVPEEE